MRFGCSTTTLRTGVTIVCFVLAIPAFGQNPRKDTHMDRDHGTAISGYTFGSAELAKSPITAADLDLLKATLLWSADDDRYLKLAGEVLEDQTDAVLDTWYGYVGAHPHLLQYFSSAEGRVDNDYLAAVRKRFGQWILDTCRRPYDQAWLDYQYEIALRHHHTKKNEVDGAEAVDHIGQRYLIAFIYPITATIKPFLGKKGHSSVDVEGMYNAWFKAVTLHVTLWTYPYANSGEF